MLFRLSAWLPVLLGAVLALGLSGCAGEKEAAKTMQLLADNASKDNQRRVGQISLWKQQGFYYYYRIGVALPNAKVPKYCEVEVELLNDGRRADVLVWGWADHRGSTCAGMGGRYDISHKDGTVTRLTFHGKPG